MSRPVRSPLTVTDGPKNLFLTLTCLIVRPSTERKPAKTLSSILLNETPVTTVALSGAIFDGSLVDETSRMKRDHTYPVFDLKEILIERGRQHRFIGLDVKFIRCEYKSGTELFLNLLASGLMLPSTERASRGENVLSGNKFFLAVIPTGTTAIERRHENSPARSFIVFKRWCRHLCPGNTICVCILIPPAASRFKLSNRTFIAQQRSPEVRVGGMNQCKKGWAFV
jgi:hypothetical protein